jgi:hypothetical protein
VEPPAPKRVASPPAAPRRQSNQHAGGGNTMGM